MPPFSKAWQKLGPIRPELVRRFGLPADVSVLTGGHDSSLNHYRYHAAGLRDFTVISTGTWIVGFSRSTPIERLDGHRGMTLNSDVFGNRLGGILTMGGREFSHIAGSNPPTDDVPIEVLGRLVAQRTLAAPSFGDDDGLFPGSAGSGGILGPAAETAMERKGLALLYCALLTVECIEALSADRLIVLDGSFLRDPLYAGVVAALLPKRQVRFNLDALVLPPVRRCLPVTRRVRGRRRWPSASPSILRGSIPTFPATPPIGALSPVQCGQQR